MKEIKDLIEVSRYYGNNKEYTLAGGGNTSYKNDEYLWIKASGAKLGSITEEGFAQLDRGKVKIVGEKKYSEDEQKREVEVKHDLIAANVYPEKGKRPSVETSFHELINYAFVVHTHPTIINALMCSRDSKKKTEELFGPEALYVKYAPGYSLFLIVKEAVEAYRSKYTNDPKLIFLENHGIFISADSTDEIRELYAEVTAKIKEEITNAEDIKPLPIKEDFKEFLPHIRAKLSNDRVKVAVIRHNTLHANFYNSPRDFEKGSLPFTPDIIVYCKSSYLFVEDSDSPKTIIESFDRKLDDFKSRNGYLPKIVLIKDYGLVAIEDNTVSAEIAAEVYEDLLKVSLYSESFGGPRFLGQKEIEFVDNWEVENYRRKISKGQEGNSKVDQKIVVVTGAAQGFGEGIAREMVLQGANVVIADLNEEKGRETVQNLKSACEKNNVLFCKVDVSDPGSVENLVSFTVESFGGLDAFISNAGILYAGGIDELDPSLFQKMTEVNYNAWFYCVRFASQVMKIQSAANEAVRGDLIQINSKSGLQGSNRNYAYAGAKFGGIGLTQSFAMELAPFGIKVNSVCPGNFFEGPLWSDPNKGLFVQYLEAGKVPGAKSIEDVKRFYEEKVPLNRGCRVEDVMKAILYVIDQQYETGQAIPVTGGQVMLK